MSTEPFLGEIQLVGFTFVPRGWAECNGQLLSIAQNQALFSLLGTFYGGDGRSTFALPDLRGRMAIHAGGNFPGERGGLESVTLTGAQMPSHAHTLKSSSDNSHAVSPAGRVFGPVEKNGLNTFHQADGSAALHPQSVTSSGGNQPHSNMQPYITSMYVIALQGIFPSRN